MNTALLIIDLQNDYFSGGKMELANIDAAAEKAGKLLKMFRGSGGLIVHVRHLSVRPNATFFIPGTPGSEIHDSVLPQPGEKIVEKNFPNSFRDTGLHQFLQSENVTKLLVCGAMTHMCIDTTVRAAFDLGYQTTLISDACATRDLVFEEEKIEAQNVQKAYLGAINGIFAQVMRFEQYSKI